MVCGERKQKTTIEVIIASLAMAPAEVEFGVELGLTKIIILCLPIEWDNHNGKWK